MIHPDTLGIVTGLAAEARLARPLGLVRAGGGTPEGAQAAAEWLVGQGVDALLSFGLAGGLDPALRAGDIVTPQAVREGDVDYPTSPGLTARFGTPAGLLLAGTAVLATPAAKAAMFARTGAVAVDLESGAVARVAQRHHKPFAVLRAICDPASRTLPPAALTPLDATGSIMILHVLAAIARDPGQIPALVRVAREAAIARSALRQRVGRV